MPVPPLPIRWIGHSFPAAQRHTLVCDVSRNMHLKPNHSALLEFYCAQRAGFRPAEAYIASRIGVTPRWTRKLRQQLADLGVIGVDAEGVYIDWNRLRIYATLDPKQTSRKAFALPIPTRAARTHDAVKYLTCGIDKAVSILSSLSEDGYARLLFDVARVSAQTYEDPSLEPHVDLDPALEERVGEALLAKDEWLFGEPLPF